MSNKKNQRVLNNGLEEVLKQCREAAKNALHTTVPRSQMLRDVLSAYRQAVEKIDTGTLRVIRIPYERQRKCSLINSEMSKGYCFALLTKQVKNWIIVSTH